MAHIGERAVAHGYTIIVDNDDAAQRMMAFTIVSDALARIASSAPHTDRRMRRDVHQILVMPAKTAAYFHPGTILIPCHAFDEADSDAVAGYIVHEAVHARIEKHRIRYWPDLQARIERRCLREQIAFLASRPGRSDLVQRFERYLHRQWPEGR